MPKKAVVKQSKKLTKKTAAPKSATTKKPSAVKSAYRKSVKFAKKSVKKATPVTPVAKKAKPVPAKVAPVAKAPLPSEEISLGRPLVTQEEKLYMLFHDDYQARQVFEFLRVDTVKELEQFSQQQIVHMMSKPLRMTVDRIRQRLAQFKRSLKDDEHFAADFLRKSE